MNKKPAVYINSPALGDTICAIPTINKLAEAHEQPLTVFTTQPELFYRHPSVFQTKGLDESIDNYTLYKTFVTEKRNHAVMDIRLFHCTHLGFSLTSDELFCDLYIENEYEIIENNKPIENYVILHPVDSEAWPSRTWGKEKYEDLIKGLNDLNIKVVLIGRDTTEFSTYHRKVVEKKVMDVDGDYYDLRNNYNIGVPEIRWMMNNRALCTITIDSGILHVAGTTDGEIIQLGSSIDYKLRAPWRKGVQNYKYTYIKGECDIKCASNMKYYLKEWGYINGVPPIGKCLENYSEFKCHSEVNKVITKVKKLL